MTAKATILVADDDPIARDLLAEVLIREGYRVLPAAGGEECVRIAAAEPVDLALVDLRMPDVDGLDVVKRLAARQPPVPVVILTAFAAIESAIDAIRSGAWDYLSKPFRVQDVAVVVRRALEAQRLTRDHGDAPRERPQEDAAEYLIGQSAEMVAIYTLIARVAPLDTTVLVEGETGTGKEGVARAIHRASPRGDRPFVVVDCTALPEALFESELFGHERGAFTGATQTRRGLLETADGSTCLLDEVGDLSLLLQSKLLRVLQERVIRRVGGNEAIPVDVRIIGATNRDLRKRVEEGTFREDLYFRLNVVTIHVPALRDRPDDIPLLAEHFLTRYAAATGKPVTGFAPETIARLAAYRWPGNVRELQHVVERAVALSASPLLLPDDLPPDVAGTPPSPVTPPRRHMTLEELKRWYVHSVLEETGGNKARAAEVLGIDRRTLYRMLDRGTDGDDAP